MSKYSATINGIQAIVCDFDLITNEKGEYIVFDPDIPLDYFSLNFIVTTEEPTCKIESFNNISVTIDKVGNYLYNDGNYTVSEYKATISTHKYSADINAYAV